jgi:hypothetical protein
MVITSIDLFNVLKEKIGEQQAKSLTEYIEVKVEQKFESQKQMLATKEDVKNLEIKLAETKSDLLKWVFAMFVSLALMIIGLYIK